MFPVAVASRCGFTCCFFVSLINVLLVVCGPCKFCSIPSCGRGRAVNEIWVPRCGKLMNQVIVCAMEQRAAEEDERLDFGFVMLPEVG